jgi:DNA polymerase III epsilon subunit-like protein
VPKKYLDGVAYHQETNGDEMFTLVPLSSKEQDMKILGLDFETTGLEASQASVIEIGAVVWDTEAQKPLALQSDIVKPHDFTELPKEITDITGITDQMINDFGSTPELAFLRLNDLVTQVDVIVAHNAAFDRAFYTHEMQNLDFEIEPKTWVCTVSDVPYPKSISTRKLGYLASEHKILNPFSHRAVFDVLTMLNILSHYKIEEVLERSKSPNVKVTALVSFEEKDKAKNLGFRWDGKNRTWNKHYKECDIENLEFPFEVRVEQQPLNL